MVHAGTDDSGLPRFFDPDNWEVLVKVLDGCAVNGHVWVFAASTTDLGYAIRVTDTTDGAERLYRNEPGRPAAGRNGRQGLSGGLRTGLNGRPGSNRDSPTQDRQIQGPELDTSVSGSRRGRRPGPVGRTREGRARCRCPAAVREARGVANLRSLVRSATAKRAAAALLVVGVAAEAGAQEPPPTRSASPGAAALAPLSEIPVLEAPPIVPLIRVAQEQAAGRSPSRGRRRPRGRRRSRGGAGRTASPTLTRSEATPVTHGRWETTSDGANGSLAAARGVGGRVSLNLGFTRYRMPPGGRLWVYGADGSEVVGPFTEDDNQAHGELWTPILAGSQVVIEVAGAGGPGKPNSTCGSGPSTAASGTILPERTVSGSHANCHNRRGRAPTRIPTAIR